MWGFVLTRPAALRSAVVAIALSAAFAAEPARAAELIDFSEVPLNTRVDGAKIEGVTFNFTVNNVASPLATVTMTGPGTTTITKAPNIEGPANGVLSLAFGTPVRDFGFSFITSTNQGSPNGLTVTMHDANGGTSSQTFATTTIGAFSGVRVDNVPAVPVVRLVIDPNTALNGARFAIDNVNFTPVPEPGGLAVLGGFAVALFARRRRC